MNNSTINYESSVKLLGIVFDSKLIWHDHIKSLKKNIIQKLTLLKQLANLKWGSSPKTMIDFYKVYIRAKMEYGIQFFANSLPQIFNMLESLQNSAICIAMGFHKHTPIIKMRNLSGIPSLEERALFQRRRYFTRIQAYGDQHYVYQKVFHNTPSMILVSSTWNLFLKEVPEWSSQWMDTFPFVDSPPWEMDHIECHMSMLKKNKSCYSAKEVKIIF